jgi:hypothetical protein
MAKRKRIIKSPSEDSLPRSRQRKLVKAGYHYDKGAWRFKGGKGGSGKKGGGLSKNVKRATKGASVYDPSQILRDKDLQRAVRGLIRLQTRPAIREASRQIGQLKRSQSREVRQANALGTQASSNVESYYNRLAGQGRNALASSQAAGARLTSSVAGQGEDTQEAIGAAGAAAQSAIGPYPGQAISARDQLAQMIAAQQGYAAREQAALNAQAQGQSAGFQGMQTGINAANQMTGARATSDINRQVQNNIADIRQGYRGDISQLRGVRSDMLAQRPDIASKTLGELRESERNYLLSLGALKLDAAQLQSGTNYSNVSTKNYMKLNKQKAKLERERIRLQNKANHSLLNAKDRDRLKYLKRASKAYGKDEKSSDGWRSKGATFSYLRGSPVRRKTLASSKKARKAAYDKLRVYGASDEVARWAIKRYVRQYKKNQSKSGAGKDAPQGSLPIFGFN